MPIFMSYTYNQGGYGDFIRSYLAIFVYCKLNGIDIYLYIPDHPLNRCFKCITNYLNYPIKTFIDCHSSHLVWELEQCKNPNYNVIIYSNKFDFIPFDTLKTYVDEFKSNVVLSDTVINKINLLYNIEYVSLHIRFGDKFMECNSQCIHDDIRVDPSNKSVLHKKLESSIMFLKNNFPELSICLFTDVQSMKEKLCKEYNLISFNTEIHHTASISNKENAFVDSVVEFELLGKSKAIVKFSNTGFAFWSAFINQTPLFICNDSCDVIPFNDLKY